jgi:hypothetical protein
MKHRLWFHNYAGHPSTAGGKLSTRKNRAADFFLLRVIRGLKSFYREDAKTAKEFKLRHSDTCERIFTSSKWLKRLHAHPARQQLAAAVDVVVLVERFDIHMHGVGAQVQAPGDLLF